MSRKPCSFACSEYIKKIGQDLFDKKHLNIISFKSVMEIKNDLRISALAKNLASNKCKIRVRNTLSRPDPYPFISHSWIWIAAISIIINS